MARLAGHLGAIAIGGAFLFLGALSLLAAAVYGLTALLDLFLPLGVAVWLAPLVIGAVIVGIGLGRVKDGVRRLREETLVPVRTLQTLQENKQWLETKMH
jgi:hypothetical protein